MKEKLSDNGLYVTIWLCCTVIVCSFFGAVLYYNIEKPSQYEIMEKLADKGYSPAVLKCSFSSDWNQPLVYNVCSKVLTTNNLTSDEAEALIRGLDQ